MSKTFIAAAVLAAFPLFSNVALAEEGSSLSANLGVVNDYRYRGVDQTNREMALQGGFDYAHSSGLYAGAWGSNVSWLSEGSLEIDLYGGYKGAIGDFGYDVGLLQYYYPGGSYDGHSADTLEGYIGVSYGPVGLKVSRAFSDLFAAPSSDGSLYYDLSGSYEVWNGYSVAAHFGRQHFANNSGLSYNDWKIGVTKEFGGFTFGLAYVDTDVNHTTGYGPQTLVSVGKTF